MVAGEWIDGDYEEGLVTGFLEEMVKLMEYFGGRMY